MKLYRPLPYGVSSIPSSIETGQTPSPPPTIGTLLYHIMGTTLKGANIVDKTGDFLEGRRCFEDRCSFVASEFCVRVDGAEKGRRKERKAFFFVLTRRVMRYMHHPL